MATNDPQEVFVIVFPDVNKAAAVQTVLQDLNKQGTIKLHDSATIVREHGGKLTIKDAKDFGTGTSVVAGSLLGGLAGVLSGGHALRDAAIGAVGGFAAGKVIDLGFKDDYLKDIADQLQNGSSAIVAAVTFIDEPKAITILDQFSGGKLLRHTLAPNVASDLARVVQD
ncbi:MAG: DUF1269 domain-containing protein [Ktedonobacterales bacterium]|nr:DUF1269 domain-containing protein [Ktedonobacterales bacterium]